MRFCLIINFLSTESAYQHSTWLIPLRSFKGTNCSFYLKLAPTRLAWPHSGKVASEYRQAGHLGGLVRIKSYFSVSPPAPPSQGRGHGSRQTAPELITQSCCRQDHTPWKDKGVARSDRGSNMSRGVRAYSSLPSKPESRHSRNSTYGEEMRRREVGRMER